MSQDGVHNTEMDLPEEPEAHLPSELVGDMRLAYGARLPRAGAALRSLLENGLARPEPPIQRSFRGSLVRLATVSLALFGTMSGLAVAGALPAPVQNAVSGVAETVGFDIPDSQPAAEQLVVGSGSFEEGTNGANGAAGASTPQKDQTPTPPGGPVTVDSDASTVNTVAPVSPTPTSTPPAGTDRPRSTPTPPVTRDNDPDDGKQSDSTPTTAEPDTTTPSTEPEVTTTTTTTVPEEPTTTTPSTDPPEGTGSPMGGE